MAALPIPLIIYRIHPREACQLGILVQLGELVSDLYRDTEWPNESPRGALLKPIAALSNAAGISKSDREGYLWLLHPQLGKLCPYRGKPPLLALQSSYGFYEAYLPHTSSAVPYEWHSEKKAAQHSIANGAASQKSGVVRDKYWHLEFAAWRALLHETGGTAG